MKRSILMALLIIGMKLSMAQSQKHLPFSNKLSLTGMDSLTKAHDVGLNSTQFFQVIKNKFNTVTNSSGKTTIGNYASADIKDGKLAFNATKNFKSGNMLSINANGGVTNGFFSILNESKVNNNIGIDFKYSMLLKSSSLSYHTSEISKLNDKLNKADTVRKYNIQSYKHYSESIDKKLKLVNQEIKEIEENLSQPLSASEKTSLEYRLSIKNLESDSLTLKLQTLKTEQDVIVENNRINSKDKKAAVEGMEFTAIRFQWLSLSSGIQNNNFNQFLPNMRTLDSQIIKQNYTTWNMSAEWNYYNWNHYSKYSYYVLVGGNFSISDNFSDLSKVELSDLYEYKDSTKQRSVTKKVTAYKGDYETKLIGGKLYVDFYKFFLGNSGAFHIFPEVNLRQHSRPLYNAGIGVLYSFNDSKDKENKAKVNAELYFKLFDLTNNADSVLSLIKRNELGLRLSVPVSFFNF